MSIYFIQRAHARAVGLQFLFPADTTIRVLIIVSLVDDHITTLMRFISVYV